MTHQEAQAIATKYGLGKVHFQVNMTLSTGQEFEVGYVFQNKKRELFVKRPPNSSKDAFYLCNQFRQLETKKEDNISNDLANDMPTMSDILNRLESSREMYRSELLERQKQVNILVNEKEQLKLQVCALKEELRMAKRAWKAIY